MVYFTIALVLCLLGARPSIAKELAPPTCEKAETRTIGKIPIRLCHEPKRHFTFTRDCIEKKGRCRAFRAVKRAPKLPKVKGRYFAESGHGVCKQSGGTTGLIEDKNGNQLCLCRFSDGSGVECGTLNYYKRWGK